MGHGLQILQARPGCGGMHLLIGGDRAGSGDPGLALTTLLGEREAGGEVVPAVILLMRRRQDAAWVGPAMDWLRGHGRRVALRTAVVQPRWLVDRVRGGDVAVLLELAHRRLDLQRALLGEEVDSASALLLQAQHLQAIGIPVAAHLGPLLPGLHDGPTGLGPLLHDVIAADVHDVHLSVGRLSEPRLASLASVLDPGDLVALGRAFGVPAEWLVSPPAGRGRGWRLDAGVAEGLAAGLRRRALDLGLSVDACGCASLCHLGRAAREARAQPYSGIGQPELFSPSAG